jgi:hypothetical protein
LSTPHIFFADCGYDSNEYGRALEGNNKEAVIPGRRNRKEEIEYDKKKGGDP